MSVDKIIDSVLPKYKNSPAEITSWWENLPSSQKNQYVTAFQENNRLWWDQVSPYLTTVPAYQDDVKRGDEGKRVMAQRDWEVLEPLLNKKQTWVNVFSGALLDGGLDIAEQVGQLIAVDISPKNAVQGKNRATKRGLQDVVKYITDPVSEITQHVSPNSVDGIVTWGGAWMYDFTPKKTIENLVSTLKPDGYLYIRDRNPARIQGMSLDTYPPYVPCPIFDVGAYLPDEIKPDRPLFRIWYSFSAFTSWIDEVSEIIFINKFNELNYNEGDMDQVEEGVFVPTVESEDDFIQFQLLAKKKS